MTPVLEAPVGPALAAVPPRSAPHPSDPVRSVRTLETFFEKFTLFADARDAVASLRELVLSFAVQGKLSERDRRDDAPETTFSKLAAAATKVAADKWPSHWLRIPLGQCGEWLGGGTPSKSRPDFWSGRVPWVSPKDMKVLRISDAEDHISNAAVAGSAVRMIPSGSLLMVVRGMILARSFPVALTTREVTINQDMKALVPADSRVTEFLLLVLRAMQPEVLAAIERSTHGTCKLETQRLHKFIIPLPPLAEQKRIVAKVDELMALCDRLEAQQQERETRRAALARASLARFAEAPTPANLNFLFHQSYPIPPADLRKSILTLAVQGKLVPQDPNDEPAAEGTEQHRAENRIETNNVHVPDYWELASLTEVAEEIVDCPHSTPKWTASGKICVRTSQFKPGFLDLSETKFVSEATFEDRIQRLRPRQDDILYSREGGILGIACRVPPNVELCLGQRMMLIRASSSLEPAYLELVLNAPLITETARKQTTGGAAPRVNVSTVKAYPIPLPPLAEQRRIVAKVNQLMALVDQLESQLAASRATAANLLEALVVELTQTG